MISETGTVPAPCDTAGTEVGVEPQFGAYRIVRLLGEGGMGSVYLAEQHHPIRRLAALKVIKLGMSTTDVIARFDSERQALALMDHPHIARVFDAGANNQGRPYFVMEYVLGVPITEYCDLHRLSNRERMELFIAVCQAVHHAHQKGIIHRDIKPSNVLVAEQDSKPIPKIIDFGIAKAIDHRIIDDATFTRTGSLVGTPDYMSPEQVLGSNIDTTTDVYSLGVLLYELLTGALPFARKHLRGAGIGELLRIIREQDPPALSDRVNQLENMAEVAHRRQTSTFSLRRQLTGDLNWIAMKSLDKEPHRRYASVSELAADIRRHLDSQAVLAGPPSKLYRTWKFVWRHRLAVSAVMLITASLVAGMISTAWEAHVAFLEGTRADAQAAQARRERSRAEEEAAQAKWERERSDAQAREAEAQRNRAEAQRHEAIVQRRAAERESYSANLVAADLHLSSNDVVEAKKRLLMCPPSLRSWEWNHLFLKTDSSLATLYPLFNIDDNDNEATSFAFSQTADRIFWYTKHLLQSWDAATYLPVANFRGFGIIRAVSARAQRIITQSSALDPNGDTSLAVFDPASGNRISSLMESRRTSHVVFAPDELHAVGATADGMLRVWNTGSGKVIRMIPVPGGEHNTFIVISPNGTRIAAGSLNNPARVWDLESGTLLSTLEAPSRSATAAAFSPDNSRLFVGTLSGFVGSWDIVSGRSLLTIRENHGAVASVAYSRDGNWVVASGADNVVRIWDAASGIPVASLVGHENIVTAIAFTPDNSKIVTGEVQMMVPGHVTPKARIWEKVHCCAVASFLGHKGAIRAVVFSPNQEVLASASDDNTVRLWETGSGRTLRILNGHAGPVLALAFSPDGTLLASGSTDQTIRIWNVTRGDLVGTIRGHTGSITSLAFDLAGGYIASASQDETLRLWRVPGGDLLTTITPGAPVRSFAVSPDHNYLVAATGEDNPFNNGQPSIQVWEVSSGSATVAMASGDLNSATSVGYSPDGSLVISSDLVIGRAARIWNAATGALIKTLQGPFLSSATPPFGNVHHGIATFQPDGKRILASWGSTVQIWDTATYAPLVALHGRSDSLCLAFTKSGRFLASGFQNGTVSVWDTRSTHNPEAEALVESLFSKLIFANYVLTELRNRQGLAAQLRADAIHLVQARGELSPYFHYSESWRIAISSKRSVGEYRLALRQSRLASQLAPWASNYFNALGMAQYRLGEYRAALASFAHAAQSPDLDVANLAFTAMANYQIGNIPEARAGLQVFENLMAHPNNTAAPMLQDLKHEVKALVANLHGR
jgi:WD40 repeat protein/serine/threonine protein kinase